jgi:hypothetical protein
MSFSPETLAFFNELLGMINLPASDPNIEARAKQIATAKRELDAALADVPNPDSPNRSTRRRAPAAE